MYELHENEQYFFAQKTLDELEVFLAGYSPVCCLCAPSLGERLATNGQDVRILDIDRRFERTKVFRYFDINRPEWTGEKYGIIVCDPPFFNISLSRLFTAIRMLAQNDFNQPILVSYLLRRAENLIGTFSKFGLQGTGYFPEYQTVQKCQRNDIIFFSNIAEDMNRRLCKGLTCAAGRSETTRE